jgi:hypothetical protein
MPTLRLAFQFPAAECDMIDKSPGFLLMKHWSIVFEQIGEADKKKQ